MGLTGDKQDFVVVGTQTEKTDSDRTVSLIKEITHRWLNGYITADEAMAGIAELAQ